MAEFNRLMNDLRIVPPVEPNALLQPPTQADAWSQNTGAVGDWVQQQRQISAERGLWNDATGMPTQAGALDAVRQASMNLLLSTSAPGFKAYHGSPHSFERFDSSKIGTGEGAQAYGHGLYFAENEGVARGYRDQLSNQHLYVNGKKVGEVGAVGSDPIANAALAMSLNRNSREAAKEYVQRGMERHAQGNFGYNKAQGNSILKAIDDLGDAKIETRPGGSMYEVNVRADPEHFLHWDKPLSEQSQHVQTALRKLIPGITPEGMVPWSGMSRSPTAGEFYRDMMGQTPDQAAGSLSGAGIPGIRYADAGSRGAEGGTHNAVVFDAATIEILRKYGLAGLMLGGGAAAAGSQQPQ